jgi:hypothetical protein
VTDYNYLAVANNGQLRQHGIVRSGIYLTNVAAPHGQNFETAVEVVQVYAPLKPTNNSVDFYRKQIVKRRADVLTQINQARNELNVLDAVLPIYDAEIAAAEKAAKEDEAKKAQQEKDREFAATILNAARAYDSQGGTTEDFAARIRRIVADDEAGER